MGLEKFKTVIFQLPSHCNDFLRPVALGKRVFKNKMHGLCGILKMHFELVILNTYSNLFLYSLLDFFFVEMNPLRHQSF